VKPLGALGYGRRAQQEQAKNAKPHDVLKQRFQQDRKSNQASAACDH
jgi:hypothetical protein